MRRGGLVALALVVLATVPAAADLPKDASFELDAVTYLYATGVLGSGSMAIGDAADGAGLLPYHACAFVMLHPGTPNGRVMVRGLYGNVTGVEAYLDQFRLPTGKRGYSLDAPAETDGSTVLSDLAITGNATLRVGGDSFADPATDNKTMVGRLALLSSGVRDDSTRARLVGPEPDADSELHLEVTSLPGLPSTSQELTFSSPASPPTEAFGQMHVFSNTKFGGRAVLDISTSAPVPTGMNELNFTLIAPSGAHVASATLRPALLADDDVTLEAPLAEFGQYLLLVTGKVALGSYTVQATLEPPEDFRLHLWWENVTFGRQAYDDYIACSDAVGSPNEVVSVESITGRPDPPRFRLGIVVAGVAAGFAVVVLAVKLVSDQVSLAAFRRSK